MKYALHIGLNNVDPAVYGGWDGQLYGCHNDADALAKITIEQGFESSILLSSEATIKRVLDAMHYHALLARAGDTVIITYSGHGGQILDQNNDERDGLDETWVLYDGMISDDQMHQAYAAFRKGVKVLVVSDSCHSGTVIKLALRDGYDNVGITGRFKSAPQRVCKEYAATAPKPKSSVMRPRVRASVVLLSGCQDNQFSYDGDENGVFTGTMLKVYNNGQFHGGYRDFRKAIVKLMPPEQTPQFLTMGAANKFFENSTPVFSGI